MKWALSHKVSEGIIRYFKYILIITILYALSWMDRISDAFRLRMYESGYEIIDTTVKTKNMQGGRLGKVSNKMIFILEQVIKLFK